MDRHQRTPFEMQKEWATTQREEATKALAFYDRPGTRFTVNNVDMTEEQKASIRRIIEDMTALIERIEAHLA